MADIEPFLRSRPVNKMTNREHDERPNGSPFTPTRTSGSSSSTTTATKRHSPYLPTPLERLVLLIYPVTLLFGALFSTLSPETRAAAYDALGQSHVQNEAPSYFARKDNYFNVFFVKRGWAWVTVAFAAFALTQRHFSGVQRTRAAIRWAAVTGWWVIVTQWCFGPPIIDRGFRFTGGKCEVADLAIEEGVADKSDFVTATACKAAGGMWSGGHDISGHVFLLVLGSYFLLQEVGWVVLRHGALGFVRRDERAVVMGDGAVKGAGVEAERDEERMEGLSLGGKFTLGVVAACLWMLLMTAIYFHTWFEKFTGLLVAFMGVYSVYVLPRWIPALRKIIGIPGI